jgi:hypothetical protein
VWDARIKKNGRKNIYMIKYNEKWERMVRRYETGVKIYLDEQ